MNNKQINRSPDKKQVVENLLWVFRQLLGGYGGISLLLGIKRTQHTKKQTEFLIFNTINTAVLLAIITAVPSWYFPEITTSSITQVLAPFFIVVASVLSALIVLYGYYKDIPLIKLFLIWFPYIGSYLLLVSFWYLFSIIFLFMKGIHANLNLIVIFLTALILITTYFFDIEDVLLKCNMWVDITLSAVVIAVILLSVSALPSVNVVITKDANNQLFCNTVFNIGGSYADVICTPKTSKSEEGILENVTLSNMSISGPCVPIDENRIRVYLGAPSFCNISLKLRDTKYNATDSLPIKSKQITGTMYINSTPLRGDILFATFMILSLTFQIIFHLREHLNDNRRSK